MAGRDADRVYEGLAQVAHAVRRSTALYVAAAFLCDQNSSVEELKEKATDLARWIGGSALQAEQEEQPGQPLGKSWPPED